MSMKDIKYFKMLTIQQSGKKCTEIKLETLQMK